MDPLIWHAASIVAFVALVVSHIIILTISGDHKADAERYEGYMQDWRKTAEQHCETIQKTRKEVERFKRLYWDVLEEFGVAPPNEEDE